MTAHSPKNITTLRPNEVFVFGSNYAGRHGKGAAKRAKRFGAIWGIGKGPMGRCYAIATKDGRLQVLPIGQIRSQVEVFLKYAAMFPHLTFLVTPIGCGLAGYSPKDIAPMFAGAPDNVHLPECFKI